jgi:hypothetical protein
MHAVLNRLTFAAPVDPAVFAQIGDLTTQFEAVDGFEAAHVVLTDSHEVVLLIIARDAAALEQIATEVGGPWMQEHVVPLLAGQPRRVVGQVIGSTAYAT